MNIGVIFAGGTGKRMNSKELPKQFLEIQGKPIIVHTLKHFEDCPLIDCIVVSCVNEWIDYCTDLCKQYGLKKVMKLVPGGQTGQLSIYNALKAAKSIAGDEESIVLIHDGVRPLINDELIKENIEMVKKHGNCITGALVKETIVEVDEEGKIINLTDRHMSRVARAPQSFRLDEILAAHEESLKTSRTDFIDSCTMMRFYGHDLYMIDGPSENIKITTPDDFYLMRSILQQKEDQQIYGVQ